MKQKVTSIFLLATLVLSLLVGCSTDEGNSSNYPVESPSSVSSGTKATLPITRLNLHPVYPQEL